MRLRDRAVPLIRPEIGTRGAKLGSPEDSVTLIADVAKIEGIRHFRDVLPHHLGVTAIAIAGENDGIAPNVLSCAIGASDPNTRPVPGMDLARVIGEQVRDPCRRCQIETRSGDRIRQHRHQLAAGPVVSEPCMRYSPCPGYLNPVTSESGRPTVSTSQSTVGPDASATQWAISGSF